MILPIKMLPPVFPLLWHAVLHHIRCWSCSPPLCPWWTRVPQSNIPESSWAALHPTELLSSWGGQPGVEEWANANDTGGVSESSQTALIVCACVYVCEWKCVRAYTLLFLIPYKFAVCSYIYKAFTWMVSGSFGNKTEGENRWDNTHELN